MRGQTKLVASPLGESSEKVRTSIRGSVKKANALKEPLSKRELTTREKIILLEASKLHGSRFPPWTSPPTSSEFEPLAGQLCFIDNVEFPLSAVQLEVFDAWRRPRELLEQSRTTPSWRPTMLAHGKVDLVQDITTDCSVVASLCAATARSEHGNPDIITRNIYPYDRSLKQLTISTNGKYILRLHFNGCPRSVIIDDRLPVSRTSRVLHVTDRNNPGLLWPALVEKAYLKVRGGYDFPGSNSGTDLWVLTGWIPEQIFLQSDDIARNALWRRTLSAFNYGDVLITLGTGKLTPNEEEGLGLAGEHDYAVINMKELEGQQLFLVKNPWSEGTVWKGHVYRGDAMMENDMAKTSTRDTEPLAPGTFWMGLNDIFQSFESMYLNWNPGLFSHREDIHFQWNLTESSSPEGSFATNPQYEVRSTVGGTVWALLSRHFTSRDDESDKDPNLSENGDTVENGFISLYAFDNNGERVFSSDEATVHGPYVDSPNTLLKLELPDWRAYTIVVSGLGLPRSVNTFTLSAFSLDSLSLVEAQDKYIHTVLQNGAWTPFTAGGNASSSSYRTNPQFSLYLAVTSNVAILLGNSSECYPVHVKLVWANGKQIQSIKTRDIVGDSGEYRKGYAFAEIQDVQAGVYTIVCSTFEQGQLGKFTLRVSSMSACVVNRIPAATAGRFVTKVQAALHAPGSEFLWAPLISHRLNRISISARSRVEDSRSEKSTKRFWKLEIHHGHPRSERIVAVSRDDEFLDGQGGVWIGDFGIEPDMCEDGGLWLVLERLECSVPQTAEYVDVEIFSDCPIKVGDWI
ncbi:MAG: Calpain-like cysteine peptidase [Alectoria sarmentosa]|nr:MAG: Calpain-like cysteine peptidase [Alectoria sarmentosa]